MRITWICFIIFLSRRWVFALLQNIMPMYFFHVSFLQWRFKPGTRIYCRKKCRFSFRLETRSINTSWGVVKGELVYPNGDDLPAVTQYLGIPYGVAPTGQVSLSYFFCEDQPIICSTDLIWQFLLPNGPIFPKRQGDCRLLAFKQTFLSSVKRRHSNRPLHSDSTLCIAFCPNWSPSQKTVSIWICTFQRGWVSENSIFL